MQCGNTKSTKGNGLVHVILATESSIKNESIKISAIGNMTPLRSSGPLWRGVMESGRIDPMPATGPDAPSPSGGIGGERPGAPSKRD